VDFVSFRTCKLCTMLLLSCVTQFSRRQMGRSRFSAKELYAEESIGFDQVDVTKPVMLMCYICVCASLFKHFYAVNAEPLYTMLLLS